MNSKTFELDFADGCLSGAEDVADRIEHNKKTAGPVASDAVAIE